MNIKNILFSIALFCVYTSFSQEKKEKRKATFLFKPGQEVVLKKSDLKMVVLDTIKIVNIKFNKVNYYKCILYMDNKYKTIYCRESKLKINKTK